MVNLQCGRLHQVCWWSKLILLASFVIVYEEYLLNQRPKEYCPMHEYFVIFRPTYWNCFCFWSGFKIKTIICLMVILFVPFAGIKLNYNTIIYTRAKACFCLMQQMGMLMPSTWKRKGRGKTNSFIKLKKEFNKIPCHSRFINIHVVCPMIWCSLCYIYLVFSPVF